MALTDGYRDAPIQPRPDQERTFATCTRHVAIDLFRPPGLIFRRDAQRRLGRDVLGYYFGLKRGNARRGAQSSLTN
jgi:hypothetical protein